MFLDTDKVLYFEEGLLHLTNTNIYQWISPETAMATAKDMQEQIIAWFVKYPQHLDLTAKTYI